MKLNFRQKLKATQDATKRLAEFFVFGVFDYVYLSGRLKKKTIARRAGLVQLQLMGDYFLWLPYAKALIAYLVDQGFRVTLVCNVAWSELAKAHIPDVEILPIDRRRLISDWSYRAHTLRYLRSLAMEVVYQSSRPRTGIVDDAVVRALGAVSIGFASSFPDRPWIDRVWGDRLYRQLVASQPHPHQSKQYLAMLTAVGAGTPQPSAVARQVNPLGSLPPAAHCRYFILSPLASHGRKVWPAERFVDVAQRALDSAPDLHCLLVGAPGEQAQVDRMQQCLGSRARSLAGRITLPELVDYIGSASLVIGNDSAAGHIAAACGVPSVIVAGGAEYGRCFPYDAADSLISAPPVTVVHQMDCFGCGWNCRYPIRPGACAPCVEGVTADAVWIEVERLLATRLETPRRDNAAN